MSNPAPVLSFRLGVAFSVALAAAGCSENIDYDLRGNLGGFSTADAARSVTTADRPTPDERGLISYPHYQVAVARRGDTVTDVAARIGLSAEELARFNGLEPDGTLRKGEVLALPRRVSEPDGSGVDIATLAGSAIDSAPETSPVDTTPLAPASKPASPAAPEPVRHKVTRGETAYTISRLYQVPVDALAEWNGLGPDFKIREGQYLLIPVKNQTAPASAPEKKVSQPGQQSATPPPPSAATPLPAEKIDPTPPKPPKIAVGKPTNSNPSQLALPAQGKIIRDYSKGKNDGIDIAGSAGAAVVAAEAGTVRAVTADADKVPIIVIDHGDNLLTVYANLDKIAVAKGDQVKRGQKLAQLREGDKAYVHFEVRKGFDSVDPTPYLK